MAGKNRAFGKIAAVLKEAAKSNEDIGPALARQGFRRDHSREPKGIIGLDGRSLGEIVPIARKGENNAWFFRGVDAEAERRFEAGLYVGAGAVH